jgi:hypothetical protein
MELLLGLFLCIHSANSIYSLLLLCSNHGGRQVDTAPPAIECLEDIINVVDRRAEGRFYFIIISTVFLTLKRFLRSFSKLSYLQSSESCTMLELLVIFFSIC